MWTLHSRGFREEKSSCDPENLFPLIKGKPTHTIYAFMISLHSCHTTMISPSFLPVPSTCQLLQKKANLLTAKLSFVKLSTFHNLFKAANNHTINSTNKSFLLISDFQKNKQLSLQEFNLCVKS